MMYRPQDHKTCKQPFISLCKLYVKISITQLWHEVSSYWYLPSIIGLEIYCLLTLIFFTSSCSSKFLHFFSIDHKVLGLYDTHFMQMWRFIIFKPEGHTSPTNLFNFHITRLQYVNLFNQKDQCEIFLTDFASRYRESIKLPVE